MFISTHPLPTVPHCMPSIRCPGSRKGSMRTHTYGHTHTNTHAAFPITTSRCCVSMWLWCWSPVQTELSFEEGPGTSDQFHHIQDNYRTKWAAAPARVYHIHNKTPPNLVKLFKPSWELPLHLLHSFVYHVPKWSIFLLENLSGFLVLLQLPLVFCFFTAACFSCWCKHSSYQSIKPSSHVQENSYEAALFSLFQIWQRE